MSGIVAGHEKDVFYVVVWGTWKREKKTKTRCK
jgi:hypothetical protein